MTRPLSQEFDLNKELFNTVMQSLTTTFGLDALLVEDKDGGDVDTTHNARQGIFASDELSQKYQNLQKTSHKDILDENYKPILDSNGKKLKKDVVRTDPNYIKKGREDKIAQKNGVLKDGYDGQLMEYNENRQTDHVVSIDKIHHDGARLLSKKETKELANKKSNLVSTNAYVNNIKSNHTAEEFIRIKPGKIQELSDSIEKSKQELALAKTEHEKRRLEDKIRKTEANKKALEDVNDDEVRQRERESEKDINRENDITYYTGSEFYQNFALTTGKKALQMGARQALGMLLREMVLEFKAQLPDMLAKHRPHFVFSEFLSDVKRLLVAIWSRIKVRFKALIAEFKDGAIGGALANLSTTLTNIFFTTMKNINKWIRELWQSLVKAVKLLIFNPDNLSFSELMKVAAKTIVLGVAAVAGISVDQFLAQTFTFPMGNLLATFLGSLTTGILSVGIIYYFDYSRPMHKLWQFLQRVQFLLRWWITKEEHTIKDHALEKLKQINSEIDAYALELAKVDLNMNPQELQALADSLAATEDEFVRADILSREIQRRHITLPFEDSIEGTRAWLNALASKA